jgi:hypothetical protein
VDLVLLHSLGYPGYGVLAAPLGTVAGTRIPALAVLLIALACFGALVFSPYLLELRKRQPLPALGRRTLSLAVTAALLLGLSALVLGMIA